MRLFLAVMTLLAAFGCTATGPSGLDGSGVAQGPSYRPSSQLVDEDAAAILSGMQRARAEQARAGL